MTVDHAAKILIKGDLVVFPTETVYGLGADATNGNAVAKIFALKGRPATNPLIVHAADVGRARRYAASWPPEAQKLGDVFWPGPLTLVLPAAGAIAKNVTAGGATVGLRVPAHPLALALLRAVDRPIAAPSANKSTHVSPTAAAHVRAEFGDDCPVVLDGGSCGVGIESTVLDLSTTCPRVLRPGAITAERIAALLGVAVAVPHLVTPSADPAASPGQHSVHYAPVTPAFRFDPVDRETLDLTDAALIDLNPDPDAHARTLYARLRLLDTQHLRAIYIEMPPETSAWLAVRDRIRRATKVLKEE